MAYVFRNIKSWQHEVIRETDNKVVAYLVRGAPGHWHIVAAGWETILEKDTGARLAEAKRNFLVYAEKYFGDR